VSATTLARAAAAGGGELVLRRRAGDGGRDVYELIIDGVFAMDTVQVSSELRLASETLRRLQGTGWRVLVGGLGLGYTLRELLSDQRVGSVQVVELEPELVGWVRAGLVAPAAGLLDDPRVEVVVGDIGDVVARQPAQSVDAVLIDVDNGPDFLVHQSNSALYGEPALEGAVRILRPASPDRSRWSPCRSTVRAGLSTMSCISHRPRRPPRERGASGDGIMRA
jgi:Spermine/spermidine synthase domain